MHLSLIYQATKITNNFKIIRQFELSILHIINNNLLCQQEIMLKEILES